MAIAVAEGVDLYNPLIEEAATAPAPSPAPAPVSKAPTSRQEARRQERGSAPVKYRQRTDYSGRKESKAADANTGAWTTAQDSKGRTYYWNRTTRETSWTDPQKPPQSQYARERQSNAQM